MQLLSELLQLTERGVPVVPGELDIDSIVPEARDFSRAIGLDHQGRTFYGNGAPYGGEASKMAKVIKDQKKLVRRAKAVAAVWGTRDYTGYSAGKPELNNVWEPFATALRQMGLSGPEIKNISEYYNDAAVKEARNL